MCNPRCPNEGTCTAPSQCACRVGYTDYRCTTGTSIIAESYLSVPDAGVLSPSLQPCVHICIIVVTPVCSQLCHCRHSREFIPMVLSPKQRVHKYVLYVSVVAPVCSHLCHCLHKCVWTPAAMLFTHTGITVFTAIFFTHCLFTSVSILFSWGERERGRGLHSHPYHCFQSHVIALLSLSSQPYVRRIIVSTTMCSHLYQCLHNRMLARMLLSSQQYATKPHHCVYNHVFTLVSLSLQPCFHTNGTIFTTICSQTLISFFLVFFSFTVPASRVFPPLSLSLQQCVQINITVLAAVCSHLYHCHHSRAFTPVAQY